jgi:hypothetical protein
MVRYRYGDITFVIGIGISKKVRKKMKRQRTGWIACNGVPERDCHDLLKEFQDGYDETKL